MNEELFQPSLKNEGIRETKSYDISKLFYVAFFGGIVPVTILGTMNARELRVDKKLINLTVVLGILAVLAKIVVYALVPGGMASRSNSMYRLIFRGAAVLLYLVYYWLMKSKFQQHLMTGGEIKPLFKDALACILVGGTIEAILVFVGGKFI